MPTPRRYYSSTGRVIESHAIRRDIDIALAREMRAAGHSLYAIAVELGRTKEWVREYAGLSDGR